MATLLGAWRYRVSTWAGWPSVRKLTGWDRKFDLQLLSQCGSMYNCLSRSISEIHWHVAGALSKQATNKAQLCVCLHACMWVCVCVCVFVCACLCFFADQSLLCQTMLMYIPDISTTSNVYMFICLILCIDWIWGIKHVICTCKAV